LFLLIVAGVLEAVWANLMKQSDGFTKAGASVITLIALTASFVLLAISMKTLPLGTSYMVWTGIGAVGAFLAEILLLGGQVSPGRVFAAVLIIAGIILMRFTSAA
jgi:quaternary ammonium compound-resistance protein SugE